MLLQENTTAAAAILKVLCATNENENLITNPYDHNNYYHYDDRKQRVWCFPQQLIEFMRHVIFEPKKKKKNKKRETKKY